MYTTKHNKTCIFTICSKNYLHYARTLMESARLHAPDVTRIVGLCDKPEGLDPIDCDLLKIVHLTDLAIPELDDMLSKYTVLELNTAIKPWMFLHLFKEYDKVIYFDPDIQIYSNINDLAFHLDTQDIVLTPHLTSPLEDNRHPDEVTFLQCGTYNLGFIAARRCPETERIMLWWHNNLIDQCTVDLQHGLFVDQKWVNLIPGFHNRVYICRDPGWNVAYWNLHSRTIETQGDSLFVNGKPLFFFHFSGVTPDGKTFSKHQDRFTMATLDPETKHLVEEYCAALQRNGLSDYKSLEYGYGRFPSGQPIPDLIRRTYRNKKKLSAKFGPLTSAGSETNWIQYALETPEGYNIINNAALALHESRIDLQEAFPDLCPGNEHPYAHWLSDNGRAQPDMPEEFVVPVQERLHANSHTLLPWRRSTGSSPKQWLLTTIYRLTYRLAWKLKKRLCPFTTVSMRKKTHGILANLAYGHKTATNHKTYEPICANHFGINIIGYLKAESGVGRAAQLSINSARSADIDLAIKNFTGGSLSRAETKLPEGLATGVPYDINLFHINADQTPVVYGQLGEDVFSGRYNIGYWYWELPEFPTEWQSAFQYLDEVWVGSSFCQQSISASSPIPVVLIPPGLTVSPAPHLDRAHFNLPETGFLFLTMADGLSFLERKNTIGVIDAFQKAFPNPSDDVRLVIKTINGVHAKKGMDAILQAARNNPSIIILDAYFDRTEVDSLINVCDSYVSLHRSEGFGLPIAEAMLMGKPVIATDWSANTDFITSRNSYPVDYSLVRLDKDYGPYKTGMHWADPDLEHAAHQMKTVYKFDSEVRQRAQRGQSDLSDWYRPNYTGNLMKKRLRYIRENLQH